MFLNIVTKGDLKSKNIFTEGSRNQCKYSDQELSKRLLTYLCDLLENKNIDYVLPLTPIMEGVERFLYCFQLKNTSVEYSNPFILRLFQETIPTEQTRYESIIQNTISKYDFPSPYVIHYSENKQILGGSFMIMDQLQGENMIKIAKKPSLSLFKFPVILARTQIKLHNINSKHVIKALKNADINLYPYTVNGLIDNLVNRIKYSSLNDLNGAMNWIIKNKPMKSKKDVICHGDFQFGNILMKNSKISGVVDWGNTIIDEPEFDIGSTIILLSRSFRDAPKISQKIIGLMRRYIIWRYYQAYTSCFNLDYNKVKYYQALVCMHKLVLLFELREYNNIYEWITNYYIKIFEKITGEKINFI